MNERKQEYSDEKRLWRQYAERDQDHPILSDLDPNLLAAYLDGKADDGQVQQVEALMALDTALLEEIIELRQLQKAGPGLVSEAFLDRAKALVAGSSAKSAGVGAERTGWWQRLQWAAVAAGILVACFAGYSVGNTTFQGQQISQASISSQALFELDGLGLAEVLQPNGSNGGER